MSDYNDFVDAIEETHAAACDAANQDAACIAWADHKRAVALEALAESRDRYEYADCTYQELCELHDDAVACDDYAWADRIKPLISAHPEHAAHVAIYEKLAQEFQSSQSEDCEPPF